MSVVKPKPKSKGDFCLSMREKVKNSFAILHYLLMHCEDSCFSVLLADFTTEPSKENHCEKVLSRSFKACNREKQFKVKRKMPVSYRL